MPVFMSVGMYSTTVAEQGAKITCVCVCLCMCVCEREIECVCVSVRERVCVRVCVCLCLCERECVYHASVHVGGHVLDDSGGGGGKYLVEHPPAV